METFVQVLNNVFHWKTNLHCVNYYIALPWVPEVFFFRRGGEQELQRGERNMVTSGQTNQQPHFHAMYEIWIWICCAIGWQQSELAEMPVHWKSALEKLKECSCEENNITLQNAVDYALNCNFSNVKHLKTVLKEFSLLEIYLRKKHVLCPFWLVAVSCWFSIYYSAIGQFQFTQERVWLPKKPILCVISPLIYLI